MSTRAVIVLVLVASSLSAGASFVLAAGSLHEGPAGPQGATGPPGPPGEAKAVAEEEVLSAIESEPEAVARSLSGHLDYEDVQQSLDPDPADLQIKVDELTEKLDDLCSDLSLSEAVGSDVNAC